MVTPQEIELFENLRRDNPWFEKNVMKWERGPDPPDFIGTREDGTKVGLELTEWLDDRQASISISRTDAKHTFWKALNTNPPTCPRNFSIVQVSLREGVRLDKKHEAKFRDEFFKLTSHLDGNWETVLVGSPVPTWTAFSGYPTIAKYVSGLAFLSDFRGRRSDKLQVIFQATINVYTPRLTLESLLTRIEKKILYRGMSKTYELAEFVLVLHYGLKGILHGLKGILHNTPYEGMNFGLDDILREARSVLCHDAGEFQRVYLYLAFNEGKLVEVWPGSKS